MMKLTLGWLFGILIAAAAVYFFGNAVRRK